MTYILTNPKSNRIMDVMDSLDTLQQVDPTVVWEGKKFVFGGFLVVTADGVTVGSCIDDLERGSLKFEGYFH